MNYYSISKETIDLLYQSRNSLKHSPLDQTLISLVELYVSMINECEYCIRFHTADALKSGNSQERLDALSDWQSSTKFSEREKIALEWGRIVTEVSRKADVAMLAPYFSEREIVDLTAAISLMNALNRIAIYLR